MNADMGHNSCLRQYLLESALSLTVHVFIIIILPAMGRKSNLIIQNRMLRWGMIRIKAKYTCREFEPDFYHHSGSKSDRNRPDSWEQEMWTKLGKWGK